MIFSTVQETVAYNQAIEDAIAILEKCGHVRGEDVFISRLLGLKRCTVGIKFEVIGIEEFRANMEIASKIATRILPTITH